MMNLNFCFEEKWFIHKGFYHFIVSCVNYKHSNLEHLVFIDFVEKNIKHKRSPQIDYLKMVSYTTSRYFILYQIFEILVTMIILTIFAIHFINLIWGA